MRMLRYHVHFSDLKYSNEKKVMVARLKRKKIQFHSVVGDGSIKSNGLSNFYMSKIEFGLQLMSYLSRISFQSLLFAQTDYRGYFPQVGPNNFKELLFHVAK